ncbi:unnamed protein product [Ilex paraguariensis]|uniref:Hpc2-related domain-containing protein n=1 Tax=Ilex paraguariensis TaxID=185542 RepID=A0ABC8S8A1_9AQUA
MGKHSSDEEDLNDVPDDDEYDTEDSFIDDAELDEYFQVDNSAIKHDGFFVNRGKLERIEPTLLANQQPKKRRRKDLAKGNGGSDDGHVLNKHVKVGKKIAGKSEPLVGNHSTYPSQDPSPSKEKDIDKQKTIVLPSKNCGNKMKEESELSDTSNQRSIEKSFYAQCKSQSGRLPNNVDDLDQSVQRKDKSTISERPDVNVPEGKHPMQSVKAPFIQRKDGSSVRPKIGMLEKSIRELEKMVAESRPPTMEVPDADISCQAVKRRLSPEMKQKLAKVARLAQASHGNISQELINRLMSIVGHLVQVRTLKRNLKVMVNMGLSAKQEKDDRFQQIKKDVVEMIKVRVPLMKSKILEEQAGASDDFQEIETKGKEVLKRKFSMDDALEDKICDLYDLYVDGLEEDAGPLVRKLYAELAALWPSGFMDNHGIKRAICRAKDRRRVFYSRHKDQEKIKRKKMLIPKTEETARGEARPIAQPQYMQEQLIHDSNMHGLTSLNRPVPNATSANTVVQMPITIMNGSSIDRHKQEKVKGSSSNSNDTRTTDALTKKKVKRKPESELSEAHFRPDKLTSVQGEEKHKSHRQVAGPVQIANLQSAAVPSVEQHR